VADERHVHCVSLWFSRPLVGVAARYDRSEATSYPVELFAFECRHRDALTGGSTARAIVNHFQAIAMVVAPAAPCALGAGAGT
jgi:hypothetical protein